MDAAASGSVPLTQPEELSPQDRRSDVDVGDDVADRPTPVSSAPGGVAVAERPAPSSTVPPGGPPVSAPPEGVVEDQEGPPFRPSTHLLLAAAVVVAILAGLVLRFWTKSDLWLDEALTVNIARLPLHDLPSFLRRDGAPPLYYVLLHVWMGWFGQSDLAVRSLSGVMGVITLPLVWLAGRRLGGTTVAWAALILVATSPFAVRYDTENRMYALVALLTVLGFLALDRALQRPRPGNLVAVAVVTGLLLYTHYWSIYLVGTVLLWLAFEAWRGRAAWRTGARAALVAVVIGCLTFLPWLPIFVFQSRHTGTPWATPANFAAMVSAIASFAGGTSSQGRALALLFFALAGLGLFGLAVDRRHVDLDLLTRPRGRPLAIAVTGTLAAAIIGGFVTKSAFDARYASVVFIPLLLLVALGIATFRDRRVRTGLVVVAGVLGLAGAVPNVVTNRTQAGQVAARIQATGKPGDVVAYCPDQLGPAVTRLLPPGRYQQITFPRETGPVFVNWVDYAAAVKAASVTGFAARVEAMADEGGTRHSIFLVWAPGYQSYGVRCEGIVQTLQGDPAYRVTGAIVGNGVSFYQPMWMVQLTPTTG
jgi:mannosyltransferase